MPAGIWTFDNCNLPAGTAKEKSLGQHAEIKR
jgi:hypothetical protein